MSFRKTREQQLPPWGDVCSDDDVDPGRFFGEAGRSRKGNRKVLQLCKQVERSAALSLANVVESDALLGAAVAAVAPAPDSGRLRVIVVLAPGRDAVAAAEARAALVRVTPRFRADAGRAIHRKRVPELVFDVRLAEEVAHG